jgi:hypothetical protein
MTVETVNVVTRYGTMHLARRPSWDSPYNMRQRHYTLCSGTSAWTVESWEDHPDHPLLSIDQIRQLEMKCLRCEQAVKDGLIF